VSVEDENISYRGNIEDLNLRVQRLYNEFRAYFVAWVADAATATNQQTIIARLDTLIADFNNEDFATETTLLAIKSVLDGIAAEDFATETTLAGIKAKTDLLNFIGTALEVTFAKGTSAVESTVAQNAASVTLLTANANRKQVYIDNQAAGNDVLWVSFSATATVGKGIRLEEGDLFENNVYTGVISGIWSSAGAGTAEITEVV
jgi:hypothetical protein